MNQSNSAAWDLIQMGMIMGGAVTLVALLAWLAGLMLALKGSAPKERPQILRAYATCRLPMRQVGAGPRAGRLRDQPQAEAPPVAQ